MALNAQDLAAGFAEQAARWAQEAGASGARCELARRLAAALSLAVVEGHACLPLELASPSEEAVPSGQAPPLHEAGLDRAAVLATCIVGEAHAPGSFPLILDADGRLYLHRYFDYEKRLAHRLLRAVASPAVAPASVSPGTLDASVSPDSGGSLDWQKLATALALQRRFTLISGGPGTGKTSTVVQLLAAVLERDPESRIVLAAPTGKAAARMQDALRARAATLSPAVREALPKHASTVHRLLGSDGRSDRFYHHAGRRLALDVLVVDEASMLDLALATQLFEAVPESARIVLLGDEDQLAAVESGAVFAELSTQQGFQDETCRVLAEQMGVAYARVRAALAPARVTGLDDSVVWLRQQFRFAADSVIGRLASAVRDGEVGTVLTLCQSGTAAASDQEGADRRVGVGAGSVFGSVSDTDTYIDTDTDADTDTDTDAGTDTDSRAGSDVNADSRPEPPALERSPPLRWWRPEESQPTSAQQAELFAGFRVFFEAVLADAPPAGIFAAFDTFRVLCAVRSGPWGARALAEILSDGARALVDQPGEAGFRSAWYRGRPVMVLRNDPVLNIFNGDVGITLIHPIEAELQVCFLLSDGALRWVAPVRLPPHETAFAMTIHKSQGSEFGRVALVLPPEPSPVLTRELLYTGVTRARNALLLLASAERLSDAVRSPTVRDTGLLARIAEERAAVPLAGT